MTDTINDIVIRKIGNFLNEIPSGIKNHPNVAVFVPYYILEHIQDYAKVCNVTVDINNSFELFGIRFFVGYENYFVACIIKYGGIDYNAIFKMPIG